MVRVFVFLTAVQLILVVLALISCLSAERVRMLPRALWVLAILFIPLVGPAAYLVAGRPIPEGTGGSPLPPADPRPRRSAPDDDPDFLRSLDAEQSRRDRAVLAELERQFHSAEDELRRRDNKDTPPTEV